MNMAMKNKIKKRHFGGVRKMGEEVLVVFGHKSVFWKWMLSYLIVMLVLILCNGITFLHSKRILEENQKQENDKAAEQIFNGLSGILETMEVFGNAVLVDGEMSFLGHDFNWKNENTTYAKYKLYDLLGRYKKINGNYSEVLLYFEHNDYIIASNSANVSEYYRKIYAESMGNISEEEWKGILSGCYPELSMKKAGEDLDKIFFIKTVQENKGDRAKVNILFLYDRSILAGLLFNSDAHESSFILEEGSFRDILVDSSFQELETANREALLAAAREKAQMAVLPQSGETVYFKYYENGGRELTAYWFNSIYFNSVMSFQRNILILFVLSVTFSFLLMLVCLWHNYKQVRDLLELLKFNGSEDVEDNEFAVIGGKLIQIQQNLRETGNKLERQNRFFRKEYIGDLLRGTYSEETGCLREVYGIEWISDEFCVLLFYMEAFDLETNLQLQNIPKKALDLDCVRFILNNVFSELFQGKDCTVYETVLSGIMAMVVNFPPQGACSARQLVRDVVRESFAFIDRHFDIKYLVAAGEVHRGTGEIAVSYQEAVRTMEMKRVYGMEECLFYSELNLDVECSYSYPAEAEKELMRQIQSGCFERAGKLLEDIFDKNMEQAVPRPGNTMSYLFMDIWCTILKTLENNEESRRLIKSLQPEINLYSTDVRKMKEGLLHILEEVCAFLSVKQDFADEEELCRRILDYIRKNYRDSNISVTSIADYFEVPAVEMSKMFRKTVGKKIPAVISQVRLEKAKELLLTGQYNMNEIAEETGFGTMRTFLRTYKQAEGMTPSQWREIRK